MRGKERGEEKIEEKRGEKRERGNKGTQNPIHTRHEKKKCWGMRGESLVETPPKKKVERDSGRKGRLIEKKCVKKWKVRGGEGGGRRERARRNG